MLSRGVDGDAVSSFSFFYLKTCRFFLLRGKLRFLQIFFSVAWLLPMNVFKLEGFLFFFRIFLKMSSEESFFFPGEEMVTLKLFSFSRLILKKSQSPRKWWAGSTILLFLSMFRRWWGNQMFSKSVLILEDIRRTKLMSIFRCRSEVFSFFFFKVAMSVLVEFFLKMKRSWSLQSLAAEIFQDV